ncbi:DUF1772 domain-containing protein [Microlunatus speluncae]|uniref:anthrone oxygenase family protein n=1 Tax=Microlunatus speluncae TaxID=2594267 RepID=UPI0012663202|nr:anthrone oxygenase family protein [Microlunatus speluncae]
MAESGLLIIIGLLTALGSGLAGGFYLTFSASIMAGLDRLGPSAATRGMQSFNITVVRPPLMTVLFGTGLLGIVLIIVALITSAGSSTWLLVIGAVIYIVGSPILTMAYNVPRNNALDRTDPDGPEIAEQWARYNREWTAANHVRTLACLIATVLIILGLVGL